MRLWLLPSSWPWPESWCGWQLWSSVQDIVASDEVNGYRGEQRDRSHGAQGSDDVRSERLKVIVRDGLAN